MSIFNGLSLNYDLEINFKLTKISSDYVTSCIDFKITLIWCKFRKKKLIETEKILITRRIKLDEISFVKLAL